MPSNDINIKDLGEVDQINNGDLLIVETPNGTNTIDFTNFVVGPENVSFYSNVQTLCTSVLALSTNVEKLSVGVFPFIFTAGLSSNTIQVFNSPENDGVNPSFFIGERSQISGLSGYTTYYDELDNNLRVYTLFGTLTAPVYTVERSGALTISALLSAGRDVTVAGSLSTRNDFTSFGNISAIGGGIDYFEGRLAIRSGVNRDGIIINGGAGGTTGLAINLIPTTLTNTRTLTLPDATGTVATINNSQVFTAAQTFRATDAIRVEAAATQDAVVLRGGGAGSSSFAVAITPATLAANRTLTLPDATTTIVGTDTLQTLTNKIIRSSGNFVVGTTATINAATTLTPAQVQGGFVVCTPTAGFNLQAPTGAQLDTISTVTDDWIDLTIITLAAFAVTLTANTNVTITGTAATGATINSFATFRFRRTGASTWVAYRINAT